jgi:hypothetical protein
MKEFGLGLITIGLVFSPLIITVYCIQQDHNAGRIEERAKKAYTDSRNKRGWYIAGKHLEPWEKLDNLEKDVWRDAVDNCGHGEPSK